VQTNIVSFETIPSTAHLITLCTLSFAFSSSSGSFSRLVLLLVILFLIDPSLISTVPLITDNYASALLWDNTIC
jgi:hypothetical protein